MVELESHFLSEKLKKGRSQSQQPLCLPDSSQSLAGIACRAAGKSGKNFPVASKCAEKPSQQGVSDSHSLLELSDLGH